ncbi:carboxymuconolactone decarboxylase family protein (plasmid) [Deinococcus radiomollis]|uniref:carboxymuconolactone decarboxylase family protein n=1 Tax=Deinococcus radiomollis TaxID=468916 RepID=UPI0038916C8C
MNTSAPLDMLRSDQKTMQALEALETYVNSLELDPLLVELVRIRVSQMNGCGFCLSMHLKRARRLGETQARLEHVTVWRDSLLFSEEERIVLGLAEYLTAICGVERRSQWQVNLSPILVPDHLHWTMVIAMINTWNRVMLSVGEL